MPIQRKTHSIFIIADPYNLTKDGFPKEIIGAKINLRKDWQQRLADTIKLPFSQIMNKLIIEVKVSKKMGKTFHKGVMSTYHNCEKCGAGLGATRCDGCGAEFQNDHKRFVWNPPLLPRKVVSALEKSGHVFDKDLLETNYFLE